MVLLHVAEKKKTQQVKSKGKEAPNDELVGEESKHMPAGEEFKPTPTPAGEEFKASSSPLKPMPAGEEFKPPTPL